MTSYGWWGRNKIRLLWRLVAVAEVDLDVDTSRVTKRRFGDPGKKEIRGGNGLRVLGSS